MTKAKSAVAVMETDPLDLLKASAVKKEDGKKKSSAPSVILPKELEGNMKDLIAAKALLEKAAAEVAMNEAPLLGWMRGVQDDDGCGKKFAGSYDISFSEGAVKYVSADKFSVAQDDAVKGEVAKLVGEKNLGLVMSEQMEVKVKAEVLENKETLKELMDKLGADFGKYVEVSSKLVAVKELNRNIYELTGYNKGKVAKLRELVKQSKPYFK